MIKTYVHTTAPQPALQELTGAGTLAEALSLGTEELLWLEDTDEPLPLEIVLVELPPDRPTHLHRRRGRHLVEVGVRYNGVAHRQPFGPGTTIEKILTWALGAFDLSEDPIVSADLGLHRRDDPTELAGDVHVGTLAGDAHDLELDLVAGAKFAG